MLTSGNDIHTDMKKIGSDNFSIKIDLIILNILTYFLCTISSFTVQENYFMPFVTPKCSRNQWLKTIISTHLFVSMPVHISFFHSANGTFVHSPNFLILFSFLIAFTS